MNWYLICALGGGIGGAAGSFLYLYFGIVKPTLAIKFADLEKWQERELAKMRREVDAAIVRFRDTSGK